MRHGLELGGIGRMRRLVECLKEHLFDAAPLRAGQETKRQGDAANPPEV